MSAVMRHVVLDLLVWGGAATFVWWLAWRTLVRTFRIDTAGR